MGNRKPQVRISTLSRCLMLSLAVMAGGMAPLASTYAQTQPPAASAIEFNIPAGELAAALDRFAEQSGLQVVSDQSLQGVKAPALRGRYTPEEALKRLLQGSGFRYERLNAQTLVLKKQPVATRPEPQASTLKASETTQPAEPEIQELEKMIVTGTRIRGIVNNTTPVMTLDRDYIDSTGISTAAGLIESLPQNFALTHQSTISGSEAAAPLEQGSSPNLRGVGEGTTLVLLNGRRLAPNAGGASVNISALPLSAIDRVDVLTDGASALYGSDAVGGVVNFILRKDYQGAETRLRYGTADGVDEYRVSQAFGTEWGTGSVLVAGEYYSRDMLASRDRDWVPDAARSGSLLPEDENYSLMLTANQDVTENVNLFADVLYTRRKSYNEGERVPLNSATRVESPQLAAAAGLTWRLPADWEIESYVAHAETKTDLSQIVLSQTDVSFFYDNRFVTQSAALKADGTLFTLPGGPARAAIGLDWRSEEYEQLGAAGFRQNDQTVRSIYAETYLPIIGANNALAGAERLELSLAGRYDDYSSFGSSFDPRVGLMWEPVPGLQLRGSWGTSYLAPKLSDYTIGFNTAAAFYFADPGSSTGTSHILQISGIDVTGLAPQDAETTSIGIDFAPSSAPGLRLGLNYYEIDYRNRIADLPGAPDMLAAPASFGSLIIRDPTAAQVDEYIAIGALSGRPLLAFDPSFLPEPNFDPGTVDVIVDIRRRNLSVTKTRGIDFLAQYGFTALGGDARLGLNATYIFELSQRTTPTSALFERVDTYGNPPAFRARASLGWQRDGWLANMFVNYVDAYTDNRAPSTGVSSHTTVDGRIAYQFSGGAASGLTLALSAQNILDRDPPRTRALAQFSDLGFDPTNASPMGRLIAVELTKAW